MDSLELLKKGIIPDRYQRNIGTIGIIGQMKLLQARALIVGAGGLGGMIIELLARQGIGFMRVIDGDVFTESNLNRQLLSNLHNMGQFKADVAAQRVGEVNSDVRVEVIRDRVVADNIEEYITGFDVIVDAVDNIDTRLLLIDAAQRNNIPLVHGAIAGFTGQVSTIMPGNTYIRNLYEKARKRQLERGIEVAIGNPATTPVIVASMQVQEVVKLITGVGEALTKSLLRFDAADNNYLLLPIE